MGEIVLFQCDERPPHPLAALQPNALEGWLTVLNNLPVARRKAVIMSAFVAGGLSREKADALFGWWPGMAAAVGCRDRDPRRRRRGRRDGGPDRSASVHRGGSPGVDRAATAWLQGLWRDGRQEPGSGMSEIGKAIDGAQVVQLRPADIRLTELGNAERLVVRHGADLRYCHPWGKWLVWDGRRWEVDASAEVMRRTKETVRALYGEAQNEENAKRRGELASWAMGCEREARVKSMVSLARAELGIPVMPDDLDRNPWLFNVSNGTLDLQSGELRGHRREDLITKLAPATFSPDAECPTFLEFLSRITAGNSELIAFLQRAVGYSLTGSTSEQALLILHGLGANGKSTLLNAVRQALGEYARTTRTETLLIQRQDSIPNDIAALKGTRMVTAQETEAGRRLAESLVKQLTGGDSIAARFLHQEWFEFTPIFKLWLATNHKPRITGTDHAICRRIRLVPFGVKIPDAEQDPALPPGILAWSVKGCLAWQRGRARDAGRDSGRHRGLSRRDGCARGVPR